jgi:hypothetical protein
MTGSGQMCLTRSLHKLTDLLNNKRDPTWPFLDSHIFFSDLLLLLESYGHLRIFLLEKPQISKQNHIRDLEPTEK